MADVTTRQGELGDIELTEAFGAARILLDGAAFEAARHRSEADRYARQREREAELLVQKARRLLYAAEQKAAVIVATARAEQADRVIDLDVLASRAMGGGGAPADDPGGIPPRLDQLLAAAISHAVSDAFAEGDRT